MYVIYIYIYTYIYIYIHTYNVHVLAVIPPLLQAAIQRLALAARSPRPPSGWLSTWRFQWGCHGDFMGFRGDVW